MIFACELEADFPDRVPCDVDISGCLAGARRVPCATWLTCTSLTSAAAVSRSAPAARRSARLSIAGWPTDTRVTSRPAPEWAREHQGARLFCSDCGQWTGEGS